jgi:endonuclease/exonuclease/phosphatase (EEP) superfamily protein YafD
MERQPPDTAGRRRPDLFDLFSFGLAGATLAASCGAWHWLIDVASHFRWYYLLLAAGCLVAAARRAGPIAKACLGVAIIGNVWAMLPYWMPGDWNSAAAAAAAAAPGVSEPLSIVSVNVLTSNRDKPAVVAYLRDRSADVVAVLEVNEAWAAALEELADLHPHRVVLPRADHFGIAVLSKQPIQESRIVDFGDTGAASIVATIAAAGGEFTFIATHPVPPKGPGHARDRDAQLRAIANFVAASPRPCIVAGDFNATPWSVAFRDFTARSGLRDTALGLGVQATWNARLWAPRIPIDHILVPPGTRILHRGVGPDVGSDHFPVEAQLRLPVH